MAGRAAIEDLVLDRRAVREDLVDMAVEQGREIGGIVQVGEGPAQHLLRRQPEQPQHGRVGIGEAPVPVEGIDIVRDRGQVGLQEAYLPGERLARAVERIIAPGWRGERIFLHAAPSSTSAGRGGERPQPSKDT